jgi:predicted Zn-dependent peptidase
MKVVQPAGWFEKFIKTHHPLRHVKNLLKDQKAKRSPMARSLLSTVLGTVLVIGLLWAGLGQPHAMARTEAPSSPSSIQPYIDRVVDRITDFTLDNGMKFIVMERHQAPVVSFMTYVDVGAAYEEKGKTGAAHFLEHLAFKGTTRIGTTNYSAEKPLLEKLDALFDQIQAAKAAGNEAAIATLQQDFERAKAEASRYVKQNEMGQIVEQSGGEGLNATTSADETRYFYSFPSNKLELWMSLESERFLEPVFREFYEEKDVILEERRMRTDNSPIGKMIETFLETTFPDYPYGRPIIGYEADLRNLRRQDIQTFFDTYYTPSHMIAAVVGDVDPDEVKRLATIYFGRYQVRAEAPDVAVATFNPTGPKEVVVRLATQPWYLEGYLRPPSNHADDVVYQIISSILTDGRTSRLYKSLVDEKQVALSINASNGFPGDRFTNIMLIYALTAPGHSVEEVAAAMDAEIQRLKDEPVSPEELERVKNQARAGLLRVLASNEGMASLLPEYEATRGSWRTLFDELKAIEATTADDIQRVARDTFVPQKLTIGKLLPLEDG